MLAKALGLSQPALSQLIGLKNRPSFTTAQAVAKACGVDPFMLLESDWKPGEPPLSRANALRLIPGTPEPPDAEYPNRAIAIAIARQFDVFPDAVEAVRNSIGEGHRDKSVAWWVYKLAQEHLLVELSAAAPESLESADQLSLRRVGKRLAATKGRFKEAAKKMRAKPRTPTND